MDGSKTNNGTALPAVSGDYQEVANH